MKPLWVVTLSLFLGLVVPWAPAMAAQIDEPFLNPTALDTIDWLPKAPADYRIKYIDNSLTYGDLRLPKIANPTGHPVVVFVHGGGWTENWSLDYPAPLVEALTGAGVATWNIEFRRIGNTGGAYPGTFLDVAKATDFLRQLAPVYHLDLNRVVISGHSSGGHLALWLGSRGSIPPSSPLYIANPLIPVGVVSLAGIPDLQGALEQGGRTDVLTLLGGVTPAEAMALYPTTSPYHMLPTGVPTSHIVGTLDNPWRQDITFAYKARAESLGDNARVFNPVGANHFDVVDPCGPAWPTIVSEVLLMLGEKPRPLHSYMASPFCPVNGR
jgi:acetyl esterase/lipase